MAILRYRSQKDCLIAMHRDDVVSEIIDTRVYLCTFTCGLFYQLTLSDDYYIGNNIYISVNDM